MGRQLREIRFSRYLQDPFHVYLSMLAEAVAGCDSILDVGCGDDSPLCKLAERPRITMGVDTYAYSLERAKSHGCYDRHAEIDIVRLADHFEPSSFDAVIALDVIEHLPKEDGWRLLAAMESIAAKRVVIFTPNGFQRQSEYDGNPHQVHRSGWSIQDFQANDYDVKGLRGWKPLRGKHAIPRIRPRALGWRLSAATQPFVTNRPQLAFQLFARKDQDATPIPPTRTCRPGEASTHG